MLCSFSHNLYLYNLVHCECHTFYQQIINQLKLEIEIEKDKVQQGANRCRRLETRLHSKPNPLSSLTSKVLLMFRIFYNFYCHNVTCSTSLCFEFNVHLEFLDMNFYVYHPRLVFFD